MLRLYEGCYLAQKIDENTFGTINTCLSHELQLMSMDGIFPSYQEISNSLIR